MQDDKEFLCHVLLGRALLQFLPAHDMALAKEWLKKLQELSDSCDGTTKIEYALYLLTNMQSGALSLPFNKPPPTGRLKPLSKILPDYVYEEVLKQLKVSYCRMHKMLGTEKQNYEMPDLKCDPVDFQNVQPQPAVGVQAHCAVFSSCNEACESK